MNETKTNQKRKELWTQKTLIKSYPQVQKLPQQMNTCTYLYILVHTCGSARSAPHKA